MQTCTFASQQWQSRLMKKFLTKKTFHGVAAPATSGGDCATRRRCGQQAGHLLLRGRFGQLQLLRGGELLADGIDLCVHRLRHCSPRLLHQLPAVLIFAIKSHGLVIVAACKVLIRDERPQRVAASRFARPASRFGDPTLGIHTLPGARLRGPQ